MRMTNCFNRSALLTLAMICLAQGVFAGESERVRVTVSGISSGAYLATQAHVALSGIIDGAGLIAGGPYHCAEGSLANALGRCINGAGLSAEPLADAARHMAEEGGINPTESLADDRVWLFLGTQDRIVANAVMQSTRDFYAEFMPESSIAVVDDVAAAHGWPTRSQGAACSEMGGDYINACDFDAAGALLQFIYGPLAAPGESRIDGLVDLQQSGVVPDGGSFSESGFAYVPEACRESRGGCRLHVAFHGCRQGSEFIDDRFARQSGLNEWAEANSIIVLYPQVQSSLLNPQGCWDWWGYTGSDYDQASGKQIAGVAALIEAWSR